MSGYRRNYSYVDAAGIHFPDAIAGSEMYYAIDLNCMVEIDKEAISSVEWSAPIGVTVSDSVLVNSNEAQVKLTTPIAGVFPITATINSLDQGRVSKSKFTIVLKVI